MARIPSSVGTRKRLKEMLAGNTGETDTSTFVRQAVRLMIEEAVETEVSERLSRGYDDGHPPRRTPVRPAGITTGCASAG